MNSSPNSGPLKRARQSDRHLSLKQQVASELSGRGFEVMFEFRLADVVAFHMRDQLILAIEIELSPRNVVGNLLRNLRTGFQVILIVAESNHVALVQRTIQPCIESSETDATVEVITIAELKRTLSSLIRKKSKKNSISFQTKRMRARVISEEESLQTPQPSNPTRKQQ